MKTVIAMVRRRRVAASMAAVKELGVPCMSFTDVTRYGFGTISSCTPNLFFSRYRRPGRVQQDPKTVQPTRRHRTSGHQRIGMLVAFIEDELASSVVRTLISVNRSMRHGIGEIYVCPMVALLDP